MPTQQQFIDALSGLEPLWACLLVATGMVYLLHGYKAFRILVVINAAILGVLAGAKLAALAGATRHLPLLAGLGGGAVLAVIAWPSMKYAISAMGGLAGSFLGFGIWNYVACVARKPALLEYSWAGGLAGLVVLGLMAFVVFRFVVITFTAFQGAMMTVAGLVALVLRYEGVSTAARRELLANVHLLPVLVGIPAAIGFASQQAAVIKKSRKKRRPDSGSSDS